MKILLIAKSFTKGGSSSGATNLLQALEAVDQQVICFDAYAAQKASAIGVARFVERVFERVFYDGETHCIRLTVPVFDLSALVKTHKPDIIQLCDISGNVIRFSDFDKLSCPVVHRMSDFWPYHGPAHYASSPSQGNSFARWLLRQTVFAGGHLPDARVAPSHWLANHINEHSCGRSPVKVIGNAVFTPATAATSRPLPGKLRFGFIANSVCSPRKGFDKVFPGLKMLGDKGVDVSLHVYGRISDSKKKQYDGVKVHYHGGFERSDLKRVFESFDILLCPSSLDNSPNVVCESLAYGRPVIGQRGTGMDSYIENDFGALTDFWSDSEDRDKKFVDTCLLIKSEYERFSACARDYAAENLSPRSIGEAYVSLYQALIPGNAK